MNEPTIANYFQEDHERLDALFNAFQRLKRSDSAKAKESFKEFKFGLQRHIVWEEDLLFPLWEQQTGMSEGGPTAVMRAEHRQIGQHLEAIHKKVQEHDPDSDEDERRLLGALSAHNQKEERVLYPSIDSVLSDQDRLSVFNDMKRLPEERYRICCDHHH